jgi:hypothetical protein
MNIELKLGELARGNWPANIDLALHCFWKCRLTAFITQRRHNRFFQDGVAE